MQFCWSLINSTAAVPVRQFANVLGSVSSHTYSTNAFRHVRRISLGPHQDLQLTSLYSVGLIGVVGATGACGPPFYYVSTPNLLSLICIVADTIIRGIGKRAHVLHFMMSFSSQCVLACTLGYVCPTRVFQVELLTTCFRMILLKQPLVIPTRTSWLVMLLLIGIFGFVSQVRNPKLVRLSPHSLI